MNLQADSVQNPKSQRTLIPPTECQEGKEMQGSLSCNARQWPRGGDSCQVHSDLESGR